MKESYGEGLATHTGPESCAVDREVWGEALTGVRAGRVLSREIIGQLRGADAVETGGRPHRSRRYRETRVRTPRGLRPRARTEAPRTGTGRSHDPPAAGGSRRPHREVQGRTPVMNGRGKSDGPIVPGKLPNKAGQPAAEAVEGRGPAKGNPPERNALRTQSRAGAPSALERVRQAAGKDRRQRFTALLHHVYDVERLRAAYHALKRTRGGRRRWRDVAALRGGPGGQPPGPVRQAEARSVPGEAGSSGVHPEGGRAATAARGSRAGGQDRPARRRRGVGRHLRNGLPRFLVRVPAAAQRASSAGCADGGDHDEEGELGARCRHPCSFSTPSVTDGWCVFSSTV